MLNRMKIGQTISTKAEKELFPEGSITLKEFYNKIKPNKLFVAIDTMLSDMGDIPMKGKELKNFFKIYDTFNWDGV